VDLRLIFDASRQSPSATDAADSVIGNRNVNVSVTNCRRDGEDRRGRFNVSLQSVDDDD
jgi:hypothetical protein